MPSLENDVTSNVTLSEILKEFVRVFEGKKLLAESDESLFHSVKEHLRGNLAPNPGGFLVDILMVVDHHTHLERLHKAVAALEHSEIKLENIVVPEPVRSIIEEAIFIIACVRLRKNTPRAWRSLRE